MHPSNYHRVRQMRRCGMRLDALCRMYKIERKELDKILSSEPKPPTRLKRHPVCDLVEEGIEIARIEKVFVLTELQKVQLAELANSRQIVLD